MDQDTPKKILLPAKRPIILPNKQPITLPNKQNKPLLPVQNITPITLPNKQPIILQNKQPIILSNKQPIILPNKQSITLPNKQSKSLIPLPKSPNKRSIDIEKNNSSLDKYEVQEKIDTIHFFPEQIDEDTIVNYAMTLDKYNFKGLIDFLSEYYYNDESLVSDKTFNQLENIYKEIYGEYEAEWPLPRGKTVTLPYHLSSLKKMIEENEINNWIRNHPGYYLLQDKIDGITLLLVSKMVNNKRITSLYTHGDGVEGKDISHVLPYLNLPKIDYDIAIRGEGVYKLEVFEQYKDRFKNPRNMITGTLTAKKSFDPKIVKNLSFFAYQIRSERNKPLDDLIKLQELGFDVPEYKLVNEISKDILEDYFLERKAVAVTEIDGTVVYQNVIIDYPTIKGKLPSQVIAFKTDTGGEVADTIVTEVTWKASKHRKLKPTVHYDNVVFKAADLKRATGHNARYIVDNNIGIGAVIRIKRSGDVIPYIIDVIKPAPDGPDLPDENIHGKYEWNENDVEFILLEDNDEVRANKLKHFLVTLKVKKAGPKRIESIVESGIKTIKDLLNSTPEQLSKLSGIGINLATQILDDIKDKITNVPLARILDASDIFPGIGERRFETILEVHPDLLNYGYDNPNKIVEMIIQISGFGDILSKIIAYNLSTFINWLYDNPSIVIEKPKIINNGRNNKFAGETVVFSGFRDPDLQRLIREEKGSVTSTVTGKTTILVQKDLNPSSFKTSGLKALQLNEKAKQLGKPDVIKIFSKEDFLAEYF